MVDFELRDARDFHGRDGRDGRERRPADHYVGISHPHFDRRMGHYGLYDYHDAHAAFAGWIADRIGNKRMYILGLVLFTFGSWLCGRAGSDMFLISARALQGFGSGIIQSLGLAIVTREFPPQQRGLALGCGRWRPPLRSRSVL